MLKCTRIITYVMKNNDPEADAVSPVKLRAALGTRAD